MNLMSSLFLFSQYSHVHGILFLNISKHHAFQKSLKTSRKILEVVFYDTTEKHGCVILMSVMCVHMYVCVGFGVFQKSRGEQRVDEHHLPAKQSISPSHRPHHTSQTHPSLLTQ